MSYPFSHVLRIFTDIVRDSSKLSLINEVVVAVGTLVQRKGSQLFLEWDQIMKLIIALHSKVELLEQNNKLLPIIELF